MRGHGANRLVEATGGRRIEIVDDQQVVVLPPVSSRNGLSAFHGRDRGEELRGALASDQADVPSVV